jgi:hypothetical protein
MQALQFGPRFDPDLLDQDRAGIAERLQRLGLSSRSVQRAHPQRVQPLAQRMASDELVEAHGCLVVSAGLDVGPDRLLADVQPQVLEPAQLRGREWFVDHFKQWAAAPQRQRPPGSRPVPIAAGSRVGQALEVGDVDGVRPDPQLVAAAAGDDLGVATRQ